jgi:hypothetical protein
MERAMTRAEHGHGDGIDAVARGDEDAAHEAAGEERA